MSAKQEYHGIRTFNDLIQRFDLAAIAFLKQAAKNSETDLNKINAELEGFVTAILASLKDMQNQIDGNITTHFYKGKPTLENIPASEWTTDELKNAHLGDLYYDQDTGYGYRFALTEGVYDWLKITDNDVVEALALANAAQDTADGKRRVFTDTPTSPYDKGDLWVKDKELYICLYSKDEGEFDENDFGIATKYTDDTRANEVAVNLAKNYTTTMDMNTAIQKNADEVLIVAAATYTTKAEFTNEITALTDKYTEVSVRADGLETTVSTQASNISGLEGRVSTAETNYLQLSDKFGWIVENGTTKTDFTLTSEMAKLVTNSLVITDSTGSSTIISGGKMNINEIFAQEITATGTIKGVTLEGITVNLTSDSDTTAKLKALSATGNYNEFMPNGIKVCNAQGSTRVIVWPFGVGVYDYESDGTTRASSSFLSPMGLNTPHVMAEDYCVIGDTNYEAGYALRVVGNAQYSGKVYMRGGAEVTTFLATGTITTNATMLMANDYSYAVKNTSGTPYSAARMNTSNILWYGYGSPRTQIFSNSRIDLLSGGIKDTSGNAITLEVNSNGWAVIRPTNTSCAILGNSSYRYKYIYSDTAVDVGSDIRLKHTIEELDDRYLAFAKMLVAKSYFLTSMDDGKKHIGYIAQDVEEIMTSVGLSANECAFLHRNWVERADYVGDELSLTYEELHTISIAALQKEVTELREELVMANSKIEYLQSQQLGA